MTTFRSYALGSLLFALLIAMLVAVAAGGAARARPLHRCGSRRARRARRRPSPSGPRTRTPPYRRGAGSHGRERRGQRDRRSDSTSGAIATTSRSTSTGVTAANGITARLSPAAPRIATRWSISAATRSCRPGGMRIRSCRSSALPRAKAMRTMWCSIFGNTRTSGRVSDSAVAVVGSAYIDGPVGGRRGCGARRRQSRAARGRGRRCHRGRRQRDTRSGGGRSGQRAKRRRPLGRLRLVGPGSITACSMAGRWPWCRGSAGRGRSRSRSSPFTCAWRFSFATACPAA